MPPHYVSVIEIDQRWWAAQVADLTGVLSKSASDRRNYSLGRDAEVAVEVLILPRGAEAGHSDERAVRTEPTVPAEAASGFDSDPWRAAQHLSAIGFFLLRKQLPTRQG